MASAARGFAAVSWALRINAPINQAQLRMFTEVFRLMIDPGSRRRFLLVIKRLPVDRGSLFRQSEFISW